MKIAFLSSVDFNLYFFRFDIMKELISHGDEVFAIIPRGEYTHLLEEIRVTVIDYKISRSSQILSVPFIQFWNLLKF